MKSVNLFKLTASVIVLSFVLVGCARNPKNITQIPNRSIGTPNGGGPNPPIDVTDGGTDRTQPIPPDAGGTDRTSVGPSDLPDRYAMENMDADRETFQQQTVYFELDRSAIRASEQSKAQSVAAYLKNELTTMIMIEGHCDERGTSEYNRSLGERRALALREYLIDLGINPERVATISYGEDRPADFGHDEAAWSKNRRGEFILYRPRR